MCTTMVYLCGMNIKNTVDMKTDFNYTSATSTNHENMSDTLRKYYSSLLEKELNEQQSSWLTASVGSFIMTVMPLPIPDMLRLIAVAFFAFSLWKGKKSGL